MRILMTALLSCLCGTVLIADAVSRDADNSHSSTERSWPSREPEHGVGIQSQLASEAQTRADEYWKRVLTKCGDSYFFAVEEKIYADPNAAQPRRWYEGKQPTVRVEGRYFPPRQLSEAQRLNGVDPQPIEWQGKITLLFRVARLIKTRGTGYDNTGPRRWEDRYTEERSITKRKGRWEILNTPTSRDVKTPCAEIERVLGTKF